MRQGTPLGVQGFVERGEQGGMRTPSGVRGKGVERVKGFTPRKTRIISQPFQPMREKNVIDHVFGAVERGLGIQQTFFTQRVSLFAGG